MTTATENIKKEKVYEYKVKHVRKNGKEKEYTIKYKRALKGTPKGGKTIRQDILDAKNEIINLHNEGASIRSIAQKYNTTWYSINKIIKDNCKNDNVNTTNIANNTIITTIITTTTTTTTIISNNTIDTITDNDNTKNLTLDSGLDTISYAATITDTNTTNTNITDTNITDASDIILNNVNIVE